MREWLLKRLKDRAGTLAAPPAAAAAAPGAAAAPPPPEPAHRTLLAQGEAAQAQAAAQEALAAEASDADAALTLSRAALQRRKEPDARRAIALLRSLAPETGWADWQQGVLELQAGRLPQAQAALEAALAKDTQLADARYQLAVIWRQRGDNARALELCQTAVRADPSHALAHADLGALLREAGRHIEAAVHLEHAVQADPRLHTAWFNLGTLRLDQGQFGAAAQALGRSVAVEPKQADAHYWLGHAQMGQGEAEAARAAYAQALQVDPQFLRARWALAMAQLEPAPASVEVEAASRAAFADALDKLATWVRTRAPARAFEAVAVTQPYYLAYQEANARELLGRYGALCAQAMSAWQKKAGLAGPAAPAPAGAPLRVGIVSAHLHDHSVWNAIVRGWLEHFERSRVDLHLFALSGHDDAQTRFARSRAAAFHSLNAGWQTAAQTLADSRLHVLVYPEVGMDSATGKLAALRLAPVQVASWGHPVTTGLPTIDHYVSAEAFEPADADTHYTEKLHRLPRLGCTPRRYGTAPARVDLPRLGVPAGARVLLCAGTSFKYTPAHDALWLAVARRCAPCRLLFFRGNPAGLTNRLEQRLRRVFDAAGLPFDEHVLFVPWQSQEGFFGLLGAAHVFLDNPGFSGFNTVMQAVECGTPIVAHEGGTMRANFGVAVLRQIGLGDWVASDVEGYAERVKRLCDDRALREQVSQTLRRGGDAVFGDRAASLAMQALLEQLGRPA